MALLLRVAVYLLGIVSVISIADTEIYIPQGPILEEFDIDLNYGGLVLYFDQPVLANTLDIDKISLQANASIQSDTAFHFTERVFNNLTAQGNTTDVYFYMSADDFARLTVHPQIAKSRDQTYISIDFGAFNSSIGVPSEEINSTHALKASGYVEDTSQPYVKQFALDMNDGILTIDFSEPMNVSSFTLEGLALQRVRNALYDSSYVRLIERAGCASGDDYQRRIVCTLGVENMNEIKKLPKLCTMASNTYLSAWKSFVSDLSGSSVAIEGFERIFGMRTVNFTLDTTNPTLDSWDLDLNTGRITLHFSETIYMPLFNYSGVILCNNDTLNGSTVTMRVDDPLVTSYASTEDVVIQLNSYQFNIIKYHENIATGSGNDTYLILEPYLAVDYAAIANRYQGLDASVSNARRVSNLTLDTISPDLDHAEVDMTDMTLTLVFTEIVDIATISMREFQLQSSAEVYDDTETYQFPDASVLVTSEDSTTIIFSLEEVFANLKVLSRLGRRAESTFVAYTYRFIDDQSGNDVVEIPTKRARQVTVFYPDINPPSVVSWSIDMSIDRLALSFTEPIEVNSFDVTQLILQSSATANPANSYVKLTESSVVDENVLNDVYIVLSYEDANSVKRTADLCKSNSTCFLSFGSHLGYDVSTYSLSGEEFHSPIDPLDYALQPSLYVPDTRPPILLSFEVNLNCGQFVMYFSEPVNTRTIDPTGIVLHEFNATSSSSFSTLSSKAFSQYTETDSEVITLVLTRPKFYSIKKQAIFSQNYPLWITLTNNTFFDSAGNYLDGSLSGTGSSNSVLQGGGEPAFISPTLYRNDDDGPTIVAMSRSADDDNMTIYFNDAVDVSSFVRSKVRIASFEAIKTVPLTLSHVLSENISDYKIVVSLAPMTSVIAATPPINTNQENSYVYLETSSAIWDAYNNPNSAMPPNSAVRMGGALLYFTLDVDNGILSFELVYPITISLNDIVPSDFLLINSQSGLQYTFINFKTIVRSPDGYCIDVYMSENDVSNIKSSRIVSSRSVMKLQVESSAITDSLGLELNATTVLPCAQLKSDNIRPQVVSFSINMGTGIMTITFSEHIVVASIDLTKLTLADAASNANNTLTLKNSELSSITAALSTTTTVMINLSTGVTRPTDRDRIHLSEAIALSADSTYLIVEDGFVHDASNTPNYVEPITENAALHVDTLSPDTTPPKLLNYELNLAERTITLTFNEAVNASTNRVYLYTLLANPSYPTVDLYTLTDSSQTSPATLAYEATSVIVIDLSEEDVDNIMLQYPNLCTSPSNTHLAFPTGTIKDIAFSSNSIERVFEVFAMRVSQYVPDTTLPTIMHFDVSIESREISFLFNEMIDCFATDVDKISFQSTEFIGTLSERYTLQSSSTSLINCESHNYITRSVTLEIGREDIVRIKTYNKLLKSGAASNLYLQSGAFVDVTGNGIAAIPDGHTLPVRNYTSDSTRPKLLGYTVNEQKHLRLRFSEPMMRRSFDVTQISLHNSRSPSISYQLTQSATSIVFVDENLLTITLSLHTDYDNIDGYTDIFTAQSTCYLSITDDCVNDMATNPVIEIPVSRALNVGPAVVDWDLDLNSGEISVYFSERVRTNFTINGIAIQNNQTDPTVAVTFTETNQFVSPLNNTFFDEDTAFVVTLSSADISKLKLSGLLNPSGENMFLYSPPGLTASPVTTTVVPRLLSTETFFALPIGSYTSDSTGPVVLSVVLDLNEGYITLVFDEPVMGSSLDVTKISLLSNSYGNSIMLTSSDNENLMNSSIIKFNMSTADLNAVKTAYIDGTLDKIMCHVSFITDLFGNYPSGDDDLEGQSFIVDITSFVPDSTPPELVGCTLFMSTNTIDVAFNEIVDISSIQPHYISLHSRYILSPSTENITLSNYSIVEGDLAQRDSNITINMGLLRYDAFQVQSHSSIGKNTSTTYIHIRNARDVSGNLRTDETLVQCVRIDNDMSSPVLESFDFNPDGFGDVQISLYFSEVVSIISFDCTEFSFASSKSSTPSETVTLIPSDCTIITGVDSRLIEYTVSATKFSTIGSSHSNTWMYIPSPSTTADISGNVVGSVLSSEALPVGPQVTGVLLDMTIGRVDVIFSKDVDLSAAFNSSGIGFYSSVSSLSHFFNGTSSLSGYLPGSDSLEFILSVNIGVSDLIRLKSIDVQEHRVFFLLLEDVFFDSDGVPTGSISSGDSFGIQRLTEDSESPIFYSVDIDMSLNTITFQFDEPIRLSSFRSEKFVLQSAPGTLDSGFIKYYELSGGVTDQYLGSYSVTVVYYLTDTDSGSIKLLEGIADNSTTTYLSVEHSPLEDMAGNSLASIFPENAVQFDRFVEDTLAPILLSFTLDMNVGELELSFSEPIDASSVYTPAIVLQNRYSRGKTITRHQALTTNSYVTSSNGFVIAIQIGEIDMTSIKNTDNLARRRTSSYLAASSLAAKDLAGNAMIAIIDGEALKVETFVFDTTRPTITGIGLDMSAETLTFYLSELVETASVDISAVEISEYADPELGSSYRFTSGSNVLVNSEMRFSSYIAFKLSSRDVNGIKWRRPLGFDKSTTYFSVTQNLCYDTFKNRLLAVDASAGNAMQVTSYTNDFDPPSLRHYYLDMDSLTVYLEYSESILLSSITLEQGILQRTAVKRFGNHVNLSYSTPRLGSDVDSNILQIVIDPITSHEMKWNRIAVSAESSYFTWGSEFVADGFGNYIVPLWDGSVLDNHPILPEVYNPDVTSPILVKWFLDRANLRIYMQFSEPVSMLRCTGISISSSSINMTLDTCSPQYTEFGVKLIFNLLDESDTCDRCPADDMSYISDDGESLFAENVVSTLDNSLDQLYLSIESNTFVDLAESANFFVEDFDRLESGPECGPCDEGTFLLSNCTTAEDRICATCSQCGVREWVVSECTLEHDTSCLACSDCPYGTYISSPCQQRADTECKTCTQCGALEFQSRECTAGKDALCDSCEHCTFTDEYVALACQSEKYFWWSRQNCCHTKEGTQVPCEILDLMEMQITLTDGMNHHVFDTTSPHVVS